MSLESGHGVVRLQAALDARLRRLAESGDASEVLDPVALDEAIRLWESAQSADRDPQAVSVDVLAVLARLHWARYQVLPEDPADLGLALGFYGMLAGRVPERIPDEVQILLSVIRGKVPGGADRLVLDGAIAFDEYQRTRHPEVLDAAVTAFRYAVAAALPGHAGLGGILSALGASLYARFERAGAAADLDAAIDAGRRAVDLTPPGDPDLAGILSNLGNSLRARFGRAGVAADLDAAIDAGRRAADLTPPGDPDLGRILSNLGASLATRFGRAGDAADLDAAIDAGRRAADLTPPGRPDLATCLSNLGSSLRTRFERAGVAADLDAAIDAGRRAVDLTPPGDPDLAGRLSNLGASLRTRFGWAGDAADLDAAIDAGRRAVDLSPPGDPDLAGRLSRLGVFLAARFERAGDAADLDAAIDAGRRAVDLTPPGHPDLAGRLSNLGNSLADRFERAGDAADLDAAIDAGRRAADLTPPGQPDLPSILSNLGASLHARFERAGDDADLDAAIDAERRAVDLTPPGHPDLAGRLSNLGSSLRTRFERAGDAADLDAAVDAGRRAADLTPPGDPDLAGIMSNLGASLRARFERAGDDADLDAAIDAGRRAVGLTPPGHLTLAGHLSNLAASLTTRFERAGDAADLDAAVDADRRAVVATPPGNPHLARYLSNLGASLATRFKRVGDDADLDAAIDAQRRAADLTPPGHPGLAGYLSNLGDSLRTRFERAGDDADLDAAIGCWRHASSKVPTGTPGVRLFAAGMWGVAAANAGRTREAVEGFAVAVGLLPTAAWHGLDRATREERLAQFAGLATDAAACAILDARPELAVELLEQGRSVLWTQALNLRSDLTRLAENAADLAERLDSIRAILDSPLPEAPPPLPGRAAGSGPDLGRARQQQDAVDLRRRKAREWDEVLAQVRALPGFEHFLTAIPYADLASVAVDGPVVIVNASDRGCHALIVDAASEHVRVVSLPDLNRDEAVGHANAMLRALAGAADPRRAFQDRERDRHAVLDILAWLWEVIAEPVLTALGHTSPPEDGSPWPRVWWCPTGPLTMLPIHAAGHHPRLRTAAGSSTDCVLDRVISSYTPILTALARARQPAGAAPVRQLTVGMPTTPSLRPLPAVPVELKVLARHFPPGRANHQLTGPQATRADVLTAMAAHSWVHMACHAGQQHADPDRSGFALWDATLTITDLAAAQPTHRRDLAFLSACQTATGSVRHVDEAIHLAAAMQFLGYRHVIATMWTIADPPAPYVADTFYTTLKRNGEPDPSRTAEALHQAIHSLRETDPTNPLLWAPYIHLGT